MGFAKPLRVDGRFANPWPTREPGAIPGEAPPTTSPEQGDVKRFLEWRFGREARARRKAARRPGWQPPRVKPDVLAAGDTGTAATWIGHSTWLLQVDGRAFLTDPVFGRAAIVPRRSAPAFTSVRQVPRLDALLVSHDHYDHLEDASVRKLPRDLPVFCGLGVGAWFRKRGFTAVEEMDWGDRVDLDGRDITFVPARHFSGRTLDSRDTTLWGGFVVRARGSPGGIYYAGDTGWFPDLGKVKWAFPDLDLAILPIGAYDPRWFMSPVHIDPDEAVEAFVETGAKAMACGHWGTFRLADEPMDEPPLRARAAAERLGVAERLWVPAVGETHVF